MRAGLYARVSREEQLEGYSIDAQLEAMRQFCEAQNWTVTAEYIEPGFTARTADRPVFSDVLKAAKAGEFDVLVTHKLDRAFRSLLDQLQQLAQIDKWGVVYASVVENLDYTTPHGRMFMSMLGALNQYFSDNLGTEIMKGKRKRAEAGLSNAHVPPYGYKRIDGKDVVVPEHAEIVFHAFHLYATGNYSYVSIVRELNLLTPDKHWTKRVVANMLTNSFHAGMVRYHDELFPGQHEAIIPQWLFDKAQAVRIAHGVQKDKSITRRVHLLTGILTCRDCGGRMYGAANQKVRHGETKRRYYYRDSAKNLGRECPHAGRHVPAPLVDAQVIEIAKQIQLPQDWQAQIIEIANYPAQREKAERQKRNLEGRLSRLGDRYELGDLERDEYIKRRAELQTALMALEIPEEPAILRAGEYLESLDGLWDNLTRKEQREVLHIIFADVRVDVGERKVIAVKPNRDFVPLFRFDGMEEREDGYFYIAQDSKTV